MICVFNDEWCEFVESIDEYDKRCFAVVHRVFIRLNKHYYKTASEIFNEESIRKHFHKFGEITSVELLNNEKYVAYVTFADNRSAAFAITYECYERNKFIKDSTRKVWLVEPANTWHQPTYQSLFNSGTINLQNVNAMDVDDQIEFEVPIFNLNEDCFGYLFRFCDLESLLNLSQVCNFFNKLILGENGSGSKHFRHINTLVFDLNESNQSLTLGIARAYLQRVGTSMKRLRIDLGRIKKASDRWNLKRYSEKINQYVGDNIRELEIEGRSLDGDSHKFLLLFESLFPHLHSLKISQIVGDKINYPAVFPNLTKLQIQPSRRPIILGSWPKLECFSYIMNGLDSHDRSFIDFITINQHLRGVTINFPCDLKLQAIANNLKNLNKLAILGIGNNRLSHIITDLSRLDNLNQLTLTQINATSFDDLLSKLTEFKKLRVLKLHIHNYNTGFMWQQMTYSKNEKQRDIIELAKKLLNLEKLVLYGVNLSNSTLVDIVRFASNLKILHIHKCNLKYDDSLISDIVHARESQQHKEPLTFFVDTKEDWETFVYRGTRKQLRVDFGCSHPRYGR